MKKNALAFLAAAIFAAIPTTALAGATDVVVEPIKKEFWQLVSEFLTTVKHILIPNSTAALIMGLLVALIFLRPHPNKDLKSGVKWGLFYCLLIWLAVIGSNQLFTRGPLWAEIVTFIVAVLALVGVNLIWPWLPFLPRKKGSTPKVKPKPKKQEEQDDEHEDPDDEGEDAPPKTKCPHCRASVPTGKTCTECGHPLQRQLPPQRGIPTTPPSYKGAGRKLRRRL